jgi:hypothetical protein
MDAVELRGHSRNGGKVRETESYMFTTSLPPRGVGSPPPPFGTGPAALECCIEAFAGDAIDGFRGRKQQRREWMLLSLAGTVAGGGAIW